ncbi:MAG: 4Fe-4S binding protein [Pseudomonadota bacterium]
MNSVYLQLAERLDKLPIGFPRTESGIELRILERWFSPEEAAIAGQMSGAPEAVDLIAARLGRPAGDLGPVLYEMSRKGLIFRNGRGGEYSYNLVPLAEGMWEFHLNSLTPEDIRLLDEYIDFFMTTAWYGTKTSQHRIIPVTRGLTPEMEILPYEHAEAIIRAQSKISVANCICRTEKDMMGQGCRHPREVCLAFGTGAHYYIENGLGREITQDEAVAVLHQAMESGLVLQPGNGRKVWGICMCCGCCCGLLKSLKKMDRPAEVAHTNFFARNNPDECTACGACVDLCPMAAISLCEVAAVDLHRCIGCGVCVAACSFEAMSLVQKKDADRYVPPRNVVEMQMQIAKERGMI